MTNQLEFIKDLKKHRPQITDYLNDKITKNRSPRYGVFKLIEWR